MAGRNRPENPRGCLNLAADLADDEDVARRTAELRAWVRTRLGDVRHERRVMEIAAELFDLTRREHRLGNRWRRLLRRAALCHDVGRSIDDRDHPSIGATMILDSTLPLSLATKTRLAWLTRHHRGPLPRGGTRPMRAVLALLRAADALDKRWSDRRATVRLQRQGDAVRITCAGPKRLLRAIDRPDKFALFTTCTGCRVEVRRAA